MIIFRFFSEELSRRNCKGLGGIHWDEIYIKKGVKVCAKTNELIGFEDVNIPENISEVIDLENQENDSKRDTQMFNNTSELYSFKVKKVILPVLMMKNQK